MDNKHTKQYTHTQTYSYILVLVCIAHKSKAIKVNKSESRKDASLLNENKTE